MTSIFIALAVAGILFRNRLPYGAAISIAALLFAITKGIVQFVRHRRRMSRLVNRPWKWLLMRSLVLRTLLFGDT